MNYIDGYRVFGICNILIKLSLFHEHRNHPDYRVYKPCREKACYASVLKGHEYCKEHKNG